MSYPLINPYQQFVDSSGAPLASGTIEFRDPTTNNLINSYPTASDADAQTNANANPLTLSATGAATSGLYLEDGVKYKIILKDANGDTVTTQGTNPEYVLSPSEPWYARVTADETTAGATISDYGYPVGDVRRYGATGNGTTNDTTPVQDAINVAEISSGHVYFPDGTFLGNWTITAGITIHATQGTILKGNTAAAVVNCSGDFVSVIGGLKIDGDSTSIYCWHHEGANNGKMDSLWLMGATSHGLYIQGIVGDGAYYNSWDNLVSKSNGGAGVKIYGTATPDHRANVNNFFGGQVSSNTGDGFDIDTVAGTAIFGTSIETNTGYAIDFTDCTKAALTMVGGWIEGNTAGGVRIDATTLMVQMYGTRFNQSTEFSGAGAGSSGNVFMVDRKEGVLTRWMQLIGPNIVAPGHQTRSIETISTSTFDFVDGDVSVANDTITETAHGKSTGDGVVLTTTGALPTGLSASTHYWVIKDSDDTIQLATTYANAVAGTQIDITAASGGGTHTLTEQNYQLSATTQGGRTFTNNGAAAIVTAYLPAATVGVYYLFVRNSASYALRVEPDGTDQIRNAGTTGAAGKYLSLDTNGGTATLECVVSGVWEVVSNNGGTISLEA